MQKYNTYADLYGHVKTSGGLIRGYSYDGLYFSRTYNMLKPNVFTALRKQAGKESGTAPHTVSYRRR